MTTHKNSIRKSLRFYFLYDSERHLLLVFWIKGKVEIITSIRGFKDILPEEMIIWLFVEEKARQIFNDFGYKEIRLPILEKTELFKRGIGESTDIVEKEMYTFLDRGNEFITLRPEATASVIRSYLEHNMFADDPIAKLFTIGPMFRRERPQKGRYRQFHQINVEQIGIDDPKIDAEVILMLIILMKRLGLHELILEINSLGCRDCRPEFRRILSGFLLGKESGLCTDCRRRMNANPLRVFDCKTDECRAIIDNAPRLSASLCRLCRDHFSALQEYLNAFNISFEINDKMVRGLDYYTKTAFELVSKSLGSQNSVAGGGRYDGLVRDLGGPDITGIGFAIGFERLISIMPEIFQNLDLFPDLFIASLGDEAKMLAFITCNNLRLRGIKTDMDYSGKSLKSQMKRADKLKCRYALFLGDKELSEKKAQLRDMQRGSQIVVSLDNLEENIIKILKKE